MTIKQEVVKKKVFMYVCIHIFAKKGINLMNMN